MAQAHAQLIADLNDRPFDAATKRMDRSMESFALDAVREFEKVEQAAKRTSQEIDRSFQKALSTYNIANDRMSRGSRNGPNMGMQERLESLAMVQARNAAASGGGGKGYRAGQIGLQAQDIGVQLQGGAKWSTVLVQQGTQIASIFGPGGAIVGGLIAAGVLLYEAVSNTKELEKAAERASKRFQDMARANVHVGSFEQQSLNNTQVIEEEMRAGKESAEILRGRLEMEEKIREIKNSGANWMQKEAAIEAVKAENVSKEKQRSISAQQQIKDLARQANTLLVDSRPGTEIEKLERKILFLRSQEKELTGERGKEVGTEEKLRKTIQLLTVQKEITESLKKLDDELREKRVKNAIKVSEAAYSAAGAGRAIKSAFTTAREMIMDRFIEEVEMRRERSGFGLRGSAFQNSMAQLQAEEKAIRDTPAITAQEKRRRQFELDRNQSQQSDLFHSRTFGKTQKQIRDEIRAEEKIRRQEEKWSKQQRARGGLLDVQRDASGNVIGGIDPTTGKRVKGDEAKKAMDRLNNMAQRPNRERNSLDLTANSIKAIVEGMAGEVQKIITK